MARAGLDAERVVDAAAALADADGLQRLSVARIAERLGVRAPSLYAHVDGLPDLRARLAVRGARSLRDRLLQAAAGRAGRDALRATADAYRDFAREHPGLYAAIQDGSVSEVPEVQAAASAAVEIMFSVMRGYGLEGEAAVHGVRVLRAAVHGFVELQARHGFNLPVSPEVTWERMIAMLDRGLAALEP
jgi:AcrR family transcriptional regulator